MGVYVALLRGINVGKAKAVSMAALVDVFISLGFTSISTVLRSGNVVFTAASRPPNAAVEAAVFEATGVRASVLIVSRHEFLGVAAENPLLEASTDGSRLFVTFVSAMPAALALPSALLPEQLAVGKHALYQWIPGGAMSTRVPKTFWAQFGEPVTTRNQNTVQRIVALLG